MKKDVLKNWAIFTGKHVRRGLIFDKVAGLRPAALLKKRLLWKTPVNIGDFLRTPILNNICERLLLQLPILDMQLAECKQLPDFLVMGKSTRRKRCKKLGFCYKWCSVKNISVSTIWCSCCAVSLQLYWKQDSRIFWKQGFFLACDFIKNETPAHVFSFEF